MKLNISVTDITDALAEDEVAIVSEILSIAKQIVSQGGQVVLQWEILNEDPLPATTCSTIKEVEDLKNKINEIRERLGRKQVP